jgi:disulfide oxidoreductase YuzD
MNCMAWTGVLWSTGFLPSITAYIAATRITSCIVASRSVRVEHYLASLLVYKMPLTTFELSYSFIIQRLKLQTRIYLNSEMKFMIFCTFHYISHKYPCITMTYVERDPMIRLTIESTVL